MANEDLKHAEANFELRAQLYRSEGAASYHDQRRAGRLRQGVPIKAASPCRNRLGVLVCRCLISTESEAPISTEHWASTG